MKYMIKTGIQVFFIVHLFFNISFGQFFSSGTEPFGVKWRFIETDRLKVIFPDSMESEACRFADMIESNYPLLNQTMTPKSSKIDVVFHNQNVISNGFVTWAPKRMEIVTTPSRDFHSQDWMQNLALHEYRHVLQIDKLNTGITKALILIGGHSGIGIPVMQIPLWVNEGDAVITETLSGQGRGALPSFEMPFRAFLLEPDIKLSYDKLYFGSFKSFVPDYYRLGYYMVAYSKLNFNAGMWDNILNRTGKNPILPFRLNSILKRDYNISLHKLYLETIDTLATIWNKMNYDLKISDFSPVKIPQSKFFTSYRFPHIQPDGSVIALKSSIDDITKIVKIDSTGYETVMHIPGILYEERLSCGKNLLVWDEIIYDLRWEQRNYSVIKTLDFNSNEIKTLTKRTRYFSPCISPNEKRIAAIETDVLNNCSLVILDANTGEEISKIPAASKGFMSFPLWYDNHSLIVIFTTISQGKILYYIDLQNNLWQAITQPAFDNISQLAVWNNYILYSAGYSGIDNIYAIDIRNKEIFQITSAKYGAFDPSVSQKYHTLVYSEYTNNGYKPSKINLVPETWTRLSDIQYYKTNWAEQLAENEFKGFQILPGSDSLFTSFTSKPYSRLKNLINIHSWAPFYIDTRLDYLSDVQIKPGFILLSQNKLSTSISSFGLSYEDKYFHFKPSFSYRGLFPVFDFSAHIGGFNKIPELPDNIVPGDTVYEYKAFKLSTYIPFRFYSNKYFKYLMPSIDINYENTMYYDKSLRKGIFLFHYKLTFYRYLKLSMLNILPTWGQLFSLTYTHSPFEKSEYGNFLSSSITLYNPGIFKHHNIRLFGSVQYQIPAKYYYPFNRVSLPRGYNSVINAYYSELMSRLSIDYLLPIAYPDFSIRNILYIKRLRATVFSDFGYGYQVKEFSDSGWTPRTGNYFSHGLEFISDLHLFRFYFPFSLGIRVSYLPLYGSIHPELIFSIDTSIF